MEKMTKLAEELCSEEALVEKVACAKSRARTHKESGPGYCVAKAERVLEVSVRTIGKMPVENEPSELSTLS